MAGASAGGAVDSPGAALRLVAVTLGKAVGAGKQVTAPAATFGKDDTIYAVVATSGMAANVNLTASWSRLGGFSGRRPISADTLVISPQGDARTVFQILARKGGWAAGDYQVEILLDGKPVATRPFKVAG